MTYIKEHAVTAIQITKIDALRQGDRLVHPDSGIWLVLENGTRKKWLAENGLMPSVKDILIVDSFFNSSFTVTPAQFLEYFTVTAAD